jgi:hypothetical protein
VTDGHEYLLVADRVDDAVLATTSGPAALVPQAQSLADPLRIVGQEARDELENRGGYCFG